MISKSGHKYSGLTNNGIKVQCTDCLYEWYTEADDPKCPKCGSVDVAEAEEN